MRRLLLLLAILLAVGTAARGDIVDLLDEPAAEIEAAKWWNGAAPKLATLRGQVVVLHVADYTKVTSRAFAGHVKRFAEEWRPRGVQFFEIVLNADEAVAQTYVDGDQPAWSVGWDGVHAIGRGYPGSSVPRMYVIGPDGKVVWHAHIAACTDNVIEAQLARASFYDVKAVPKKARNAAKAAAELRFGEAVAAADELFTDKYASAVEKAFGARIKTEVARYFDFQKKVVDALVRDLDWAVAYHRVERMRVVYKGTAFEADTEKMWKELEDNPRVAFVVKAQFELDRLLEGLAKMKRDDLELLLAKLDLFLDSYEDTAPAKKAAEWKVEIQRMLDALPGKRK